MRYSIKIGEKLPLDKGAGGKIILAFFEKEELNEYLKKLKIDKIAEHDLLRQIEKIRREGAYFQYYRKGGDRKHHIGSYGFYYAGFNHLSLMKGYMI